jgi:hypothetical protein
MHQQSQLIGRPVPRRNLKIRLDPFTQLLASWLIHLPKSASPSAWIKKGGPITGLIIMSASERTEASG